MTIEDVPFRRQDRRILNSRKKRVILRHMYRCSCIMALFLLMGGSALVTLYILFINGEFIIFKKNYQRPRYMRQKASSSTNAKKEEFIPNNLFLSQMICLLGWVRSRPDPRRPHVFLLLWQKRRIYTQQFIFVSYDQALGLGQVLA